MTGRTRNEDVRTTSKTPWKDLQKIDSSHLQFIKLSKFLVVDDDNPIYVHRIINNFVKAIDFEPYFRKGNGAVTHSEDFKLYHCEPRYRTLLIALLNSSLFYWYWRIHGDGFHCGYKDVQKAYSSFDKISFNIRNQIERVVKCLMKEFADNSEIRERNQKATGLVKLQTFFIGKSKTKIDELDQLWARHFCLTEEELDFIINYDIKYRMGDELGAE